MNRAESGEPLHRNVAVQSKWHEISNHNKGRDSHAKALDSHNCINDPLRLPPISLDMRYCTQVLSDCKATYRKNDKKQTQAGKERRERKTLRRAAKDVIIYSKQVTSPPNCVLCARSRGQDLIKFMGVQCQEALQKEGFHRGLGQTI